MRPLLVLLLLAGSSIARADGMKYTPLVDANAIEPGCRILAQTPQNAVSDGPSLDAAISTANCVALVRMRRLVLDPSPDSVRLLDAAMRPALAILDRVIANGDPVHRLIAYYAKADLLNGSAARMFAALPRLSPQMSEAEVAEHQRLVRVTGVLVAPWLHHATTLRRDIAELVADHPTLAVRDDTFAYMVARTRIVDAVGLASR